MKSPSFLPSPDEIPSQLKLPLLDDLAAGDWL